MSEPSTTLASLYMLMLLAGGAGSTAPAEPSGALVDPTQPQGWQAPAATADGETEPAAAVFKLQGTFNVAGRRSAVINGQRLAIGDLVSGAEVIEIGRDRVVLEVDGESMELVKSLPTIKAPVDIRKTADVHPAGRLQRLLK